MRGDNFSVDRREFHSYHCDMEKLKEHMKKRGLTQVEFARRLGISQPSLARYISGKQRPSLEVAAKIEMETSGCVKAVHWVR